MPHQRHSGVQLGGPGGLLAQEPGAGLAERGGRERDSEAVAGHRPTCSIFPAFEFFFQRVPTVHIDS